VPTTPEPDPPASDSPTSARRTAERVLPALLAIQLAILVVTAFRRRFVMDELAWLQQIGHVDASDYYRTVDPHKTVLAELLFAPSFALDTSTGIALAARAIALGCVLASLLLVYALARRLTPDRRLALLAPITALGFSNFTEHAYCVRTDTVALPFALAALFLLSSPERPDRRRTLAAGLLLGISFLCTQKAIYFALAAGAALVAAGWPRDGFRRTASRAFLLLAGWSAAVFAYAAYFGGGEFGRVLSAVVTGPRFVLEGTSAFEGLSGFVTQTLSRNVVPWGLGAVAVVFALGARRSSAPRRGLAVGSAVLTALLFLHDQPWPYVFVWPQALVAALVPTLVPEAARRLTGGDRSVRERMALAFALLLAFSLVRNFRFFDHANGEQLRAMRRAEANLTPADTFFDGVGAVVSRRVAGPPWIWNWDTPTIARLRREFDRGDLGALAKIAADRPKLFLLTYRLRAAAKMAERLIGTSYVRVTDTMLLAGIELPAGSTEQRFEVRWAGRYAIFDEQGERTGETVAADGDFHSADPTVTAPLTPGRHLVSYAARAHRGFLLPADAILFGPIPASGPAPDLYAGVYNR
jgi:hypothetical protein